MKLVVSILSMIGVLLFAPATVVWAQAETEQARAEALAKDIDKDTASKNRNAHVQVLVKEYNVSSQVIEDLRAKQGWGGVTIQLAMAQHLTQTDAKTYPSMTDALQKVDSLRSEGMGWGKIAKDLGFRLGPVVSAAQHTRQELIREARMDRPNKIDKIERAERPERPDRPVKPERPERPERIR